MALSEIRGWLTRRLTPYWEPLLVLAPHCIDDFMWMFEVRCQDDTLLQAYKHWSTRRYLHLSDDGRAFVYRGDGHYRETDPLDLLLRVLP